MKTFFAVLACFGLWGASARTAEAHNVWCHCNKASKEQTLACFRQAGEVYKALSRGVILQWHEANDHLEKGVLAELEHKVDPSKPLDAQAFKRALAGYQSVALGLESLEVELAKFEALEKANPSNKVHEDTLTKLLAKGAPIDRLSTTGVRYANIAGFKKLPSDKIVGTGGIIAAQRADLAFLRKTLDEAIAGLRDALPLAEKGEFAQVMLSGRNAFGDKMPQVTDMLSSFDRMYVRTCMATIVTTMQVYPAGFEWLTAKP